MRHLWMWFCGFLRVSLSGRQVNRFLNLCSRNGIHLWRIRFRGPNLLTVHMSLRNLYDIKPYLRKTKTHFRILFKRGFPFWCYRHPKLKWMFCICVLFLCIGLYSFRFLWNIDIYGNEKVTTEEILSCLNDSEINRGLPLDSIDCSQIEFLLRENFSDISWVSVYLDHTKMRIEVKESLYDVMDSSMEDVGKSYDLVANKEGVISSIITRYGKAVVIEGQLVKPGDVLVYGYNEIFDDNGERKDIIPLKADALVYADGQYVIQIPFSEMEILALKITGKWNDSMLLGLGYEKLDKIIDKMYNTQILDKKISVVKNDNNITVLAKLYVREQIGINIPAEEVRANEFE